MKRIISFSLTLVILITVCSVGANAAGTLIIKDDFSEGFSPRMWITTGNEFEWEKENGCIAGYNDAVVVETNYNKKFGMWWDKFYTSIDFRVRAFDDFEPQHEGRSHYVKIWYNDLMETGENAGDSKLRGANYTYDIEIETGNAVLHKTYEFSYYDENGARQNAEIDSIIAEGNIGTTIEVGNNAPWYNFGMRVTDGKIECYFNEELILSSSVEDGKEKIGGVFVDAVDATVGSEKSAIVFWNIGNWLALDNFEVWTSDYVPGAVVYGDANSDTNVNLSDVSLILKHVAGWSDLTIDLTAADVNVDENVNLTDASLILKYIAGWEDVVFPIA